MYSGKYCFQKDRFLVDRFLVGPFTRGPYFAGPYVGGPFFGRTEFSVNLYRDLGFYRKVASPVVVSKYF